MVRTNSGTMQKNGAVKQNNLNGCKFCNAIRCRKKSCAWKKRQAKKQAVHNENGELVEPVDIDAHGDGLWEHENDPTEYKIDEGGNEEVLLTFKGFKSKDWQKVAGLEPENAFGFGLSVGIGQTISKLTGNATTEKITKQVEEMLEPYPVNWRNECFPKYRTTNNGEGFPSTVSIKPILSRSAKRRLTRERKIEREGEKMSMHETVFGNGATNNENEEVDAKAIAEQ